MQVRSLHNWDLSISEAFEVQKWLSKKVRCENLIKEPIERIAGIDAGYDNSKGVCRAVVTVLSFPELKLIETKKAEVSVSFPYIPGLLSFRESPAVVEALKKITQEPDLIFCDGQGIAHPRRFGIACHIGLLTEKPTIGVGKSRLVGKFNYPENTRGSFSSLIYKGEIIGAVVRTKENVKPIYVSVGHKLDLKAAIQYTLQCTTKYRLPEPVRLADRIASNRRI
ncbi:MAG: deoxyribonuclease V [Pyrinomonadaceae bacterium]|nr:deoxyribonuclease V [Pyrinomonadaceae bacterium]MCX7639892.1 deoxyribonuclease V [Pyrinomonadaceae bacterium]MDW8304064.1 deoxyribonuclease V [Acidobacteriota bacterium]